VGVTIIDRISLLGTAVHRAAGFGSDVLIEEYIPGREFTVPVIDGRVFPAVQICPAGDWYDYRAKYMDDRTQYRVAPPDAPAELSELALRVCQQTATEGILRVGFSRDVATADPSAGGQYGSRHDITQSGTDVGSTPGDFTGRIV
jgi:D-alanine-D-alanine ligase